MAQRRLRRVDVGLARVMMSILALLAAGLSPAAHPFPQRAGECGWVHGAFMVANGSSVNRLFVSATRHVLALYDDDANVPPAIANFWKREPFENRLWCDFQVCARERYVTGHMQHVRILRARHTVILPR
jgi:hypothetical protein